MTFEKRSRVKAAKLATALAACLLCRGFVNPSTADDVPTRPIVLDDRAPASFVSEGTRLGLFVSDSADARASSDNLLDPYHQRGAACFDDGSSEQPLLETLPSEASGT